MYQCSYTEIWFDFVSILISYLAPVILSILSAVTPVGRAIISKTKSPEEQGEGLTHMNNVFGSHLLNSSMPVT